MTQLISGESLVINLERKATTTDGKLFIATSCSPIPCNNFVGIYFHVLDFPFSFLVFANQLVPHRMLDTCGSSVGDFTGLITLRCLRHKIHFTFHPLNCRLYFSDFISRWLHHLEWTCPWASPNQDVQHSKPDQAGMVARSAVQTLADTVYLRLTVREIVPTGHDLIFRTNHSSSDSTRLGRKRLRTGWRHWTP